MEIPAVSCLIFGHPDPLLPNFAAMTCATTKLDLYV